MIDVYVVEDSVPALNELVMTTPWEELGCRLVGSASNSFDAEREIRTCLPQLVISDVSMPVRDGLEMIEALSDLPNVNYIIISAYSRFEYAQRALKLRTCDYVLKPINDEELKKAILRAVEDIRARSAADSASDHLATTGNNVMRSAVSFIEENYRADISVADVAGALYVSESYLSKIIRREMGRSFTEYLNLVRIRKAAHLLRTSECKIYEIAQMVGFCNNTYFSTMFRKVMGVPPSDYRQQAGV